MSINYRVDPELRVVFVQWHGAVNAEEHTEHLKTMLTDEEALACGRSITDLRGVTNLALNINNFWKNAEVIKSILGDREWKAAIITTEKAVYGLGRQFGSVINGLVEVSIFFSEVEALEWILVYGEAEGRP